MARGSLVSLEAALRGPGRGQTYEKGGLAILISVSNRAHRTINDILRPDHAEQPLLKSPFRAPYETRLDALGW